MELRIVDSLLENSFVPIYGATLIIAMIRYPKYFDTSLKYFPILILYTFLNELLGELIFKYDSFSLAFNNLYSDNYLVIYNIYNIIFFLYFLYLFRSYIQNKKYKTLIKYAGIIFLIVCIVNPFYQNFFLEYQRLIFLVGSLTIMGCILLYLIDNSKKPKQNNILLWIGAGLLIYHIGYFPIKVLRYYNELEGIVENPNMRRSHLSLILIMYTSFIIGFIKMKGRLKT